MVYLMISPAVCCGYGRCHGSQYLLSMIQAVLMNHALQHCQQVKAPQVISREPLQVFQDIANMVKLSSARYYPSVYCIVRYTVWKIEFCPTWPWPLTLPWNFLSLDPSWCRCTSHLKTEFWFLVLHTVFPILWSMWCPSVPFLAKSSNV